MKSCRTPSALTEYSSVMPRRIKNAVFSPTVESDQQRPSQATPIRNLFLAGDWTATGWPATMEGAVRSGYLAAEAILGHLERKEIFLVPDLPPARLSRWL